MAYVICLTADVKTSVYPSDLTHSSVNVRRDFSRKITDDVCHIISHPRVMRHMNFNADLESVFQLLSLAMAFRIVLITLMKLSPIVLCEVALPKTTFNAGTLSASIRTKSVMAQANVVMEATRKIASVLRVSLDAEVASALIRI